MRIFFATLYSISLYLFNLCIFCAPTTSISNGLFSDECVGENNGTARDMVEELVVVH